MRRSLLPIASLLAGALGAQAPTADRQDLRAELAQKLGDPSAVLTELDLPQGVPDAFRARFVWDGVERTADLHRESVRADRFELRVQGPDGQLATVAPPAPRTYRGTIGGRPRMTVAASLGEQGLWAAFVSDGGSWFLQPARSLVPGAAPHAHVIYRSAGLQNGACGTAAPLVGGLSNAPPIQAMASSGFRVAEIAFDADVEFYQFHGSSVAAVVADLERTMDAVNVMYEREVQISHRITRIIVRTSEPDPYDGNDANTILGQQFRNEWIANQQGVPRDMAHFVTSRSMGNILGLAYVGVVCSPTYGYGLSRFRSNFNQNANVLGHELGHNWNAPHCLDACDIMCGCGIDGGFGPNDRARILAFRDSRTCLEALFPELVAHYRLDELNGTRVVDSSSNGHDGTYVGGVTLGAPGARPETATAVDLDGAAGRAQMQFPTLRSNFTVAAWMRPHRLAGWQRVFGQAWNWSFGLVNNQVAFSIYNGSNYLSFATVPLDSWTHVAAVFDDAHDVTFYVDGQPVATVAGTSAAPGSVGLSFIGSSDGQSEFFDGLVDDVQVYDGSLDDGQIGVLFHNPGRTLCSPDWRNYGTGVAGARGVPGLGVLGLPLVGRSFRLDIGNSSGGAAPSALILGTRPGSSPLLGGTVLVDLSSAFTILLPLHANGEVMMIPLPNDPNLSCARFYVQDIQVDPAAPMQFSFTPGLEIEVGG